MLNKYECVFIHTTARMHRITVAEHLGVRLSVSPPPGPQRPDGRRPKNAAFPQQKKPSPDRHELGDELITGSEVHLRVRKRVEIPTVSVD